MLLNILKLCFNIKQPRRRSESDWTKSMLLVNRLKLCFNICAYTRTIDSLSLRFRDLFSISEASIKLVMKLFKSSVSFVFGPMMFLSGIGFCLGNSLFGTVCTAGVLIGKRSIVFPITSSRCMTSIELSAFTRLLAPPC
jgi:hypothetical protein